MEYKNGKAKKKIKKKENKWKIKHFFYGTQDKMNGNEASTSKIYVSVMYLLELY